MNLQEGSRRKRGCSTERREGVVSKQGLDTEGSHSKGLGES